MSVRHLTQQRHHLLLHCFWLRARSERGTRLIYVVCRCESRRLAAHEFDDVGVTRASASGIAAAAAETRDVSASVPPGGSSISSSALAKSSGG